MFRLVFLTFFGTYRGAHAHAGHGHDDHGGDAHHGAESHGHVPHESPPVMLVALVVLALLGIFGGTFWPASLFGADGSWFTRLVSLESLYGAEVAHWLHHPVDEHVEHTAHGLAVGVSVTIVTLGFGAAWFLYVRRRDLPARIAGALGPIYSAVRDKYYVDEVVDTSVVRPSVALARGLKATDEKVVDGAVLLVGRANRSAGFFSAWFDRVFVDGLVNFVGTLSQAFGSVVRLFQTGRIQQYAAFAVAGGLLTAAWLILA
jgi:NADH-quinone oxidoreductase subunit L